MSVNKLDTLPSKTFYESKVGVEKLINLMTTRGEGLSYIPALKKAIEALTICEDAETMGELATNPPRENQSL